MFSPSHHSLPGPPVYGQIGTPLFPLLTGLVRFSHCPEGVGFLHLLCTFLPWHTTVLMNGTSSSLSCSHPPSTYTKIMVQTPICTDDIPWPVTPVTPAHFAPFEYSAQRHHYTEADLRVQWSHHSRCHSTSPLGCSCPLRPVHIPSPATSRCRRCGNPPVSPLLICQPLEPRS